MTVRAFDIQYDTDDKSPDLPKELWFDVEDDFDADEELADLISDETGWCVEGCDFEMVN